MGASISCTNCGRQWPWNEKIAGHRLRCTCGETMTVPVAVAAIPIAEPADVAMDDDFGVVPLAAVSPAKSVRTTKKTLQYQTAHPAAGNKKGYDLVLGSRTRDFYMPIALIAAGSLLYFGRTAYVLGSLTRGMFAASVQMAMNTLVTIGVVLLFGKLTDMDLGSTAGTILKLVAVAIFPNAVAGMAVLWGGGCFGLMLGSILSLGLCVLLFIKLFDTALGGAVLCMLLVTVFDIVSWIYVNDTMLKRWFW